MNIYQISNKYIMFDQNLKLKRDRFYILQIINIKRNVFFGLCNFRLKKNFINLMALRIVRFVAFVWELIFQVQLLIFFLFIFSLNKFFDSNKRLKACR